MPKQLKLFTDSEAAHQKMQRLVDILESELAAPVELVLTRNRSSILTSRKKADRFQIRIHQAFLQADRQVLKAVAELVSRGSRPARRVINAFITLHRSYVQGGKKARAVILNSQGKVYDLEKILKDLEREYNLPSQGVRISWAYSLIRKGQRSIRLGSYNPEKKLILVHSMLDRRSVPRYFVEYIVYHELLHALVRPEERLGRRNLHPPQYRALEKKFAHFKRARSFEKQLIAHWLD
jgi:hypothetical protein